MYCTFSSIQYSYTLGWPLVKRKSMQLFYALTSYAFHELLIGVTPRLQCKVVTNTRNTVKAFLPVNLPVFFIWFLARWHRTWCMHERRQKTPVNRRFENPSPQQKIRQNWLFTPTWWCWLWSGTGACVDKRNNLFRFLFHFLFQQSVIVPQSLGVLFGIWVPLTITNRSLR